MSEEIKEFREEVNKRFDNLETTVNKRFDNVEGDMGNIKGDILDIKSENTQISSMLRLVLEKLGKVEENIDWLMKKQEITDHELTASKAQYDRLEAKLR